MCAVASLLGNIGNMETPIRGRPDFEDFLSSFLVVSFSFSTGVGANVTDLFKVLILLILRVVGRGEPGVANGT